MSDSGLTSKSTVFDYAFNSAKNIISSEAKKANVELSKDALNGLAKRIADIDKSYSVSQIKKDLGSGAEWYLDLEKSKAKQLKSQVYEPLESIFLEVGTEFMKNMSTFLSANPTEAAEKMRKEIDRVIDEIKKAGDEGDVEKLEKQLKRVTAAGGLESIVPTEGITFVYKGKLYKYTGIFAPLHQIRSILAYKK
jgi:guanylate kinase